MKIIKTIKIILFNLLLLNIIIIEITAQGLSTSFSKLLLENLQIGTTYSFKSNLNYPFDIISQGNEERIINIHSIYPKKLKQGFKSIPNLDWVKIKPDYFILKPSQKQEVDIIISIPDDPKLIGKKYAVGLKTKAKSIKNQFLGMGIIVNSTIMFTVADKEEQAGLIKNLQKPSMNFKLEPQNIYLTNIAQGKKNYQGVIKVINNDKNAHTYFIKSFKVSDTTAKLLQQYQDFPDLSFIQFAQNKIYIKPKSSKKIYYNVFFPEVDKYKNQKYMFIIAVENKSANGISSVRYARVYIHTK